MLCYSDYRLMGTDIEFYFCTLPMNTFLEHLTQILFTQKLQFSRKIQTFRSYLQVVYMRTIYLQYRTYLSFLMFRYLWYIARMQITSGVVKL
jgi:hypothetical protein